MSASANDPNEILRKLIAELQSDGGHAEIDPDEHFLHMHCQIAEDVERKLSRENYLRYCRALARMLRGEITSEEARQELIAVGRQPDDAEMIVRDYQNAYEPEAGT